MAFLLSLAAVFGSSDREPSPKISIESSDAYDIFVPDLLHIFKLSICALFGTGSTRA